MQTTVENAEKHTVKLTVEIPPDEYSKELDAACKSIAEPRSRSRFRKGRVPKQIIDAQIGREVVRDSSWSTPCLSTTGGRCPIGGPRADRRPRDRPRGVRRRDAPHRRGSARLELTESDYSG